MTHFIQFINTLKSSIVGESKLEFVTVKKTLEEKGLVVKSFRGLHIVSYSKRTGEGLQPNYKDPLVRECRGLIFDENFNIVCPGFNKFYDNETDKCFMKESDMKESDMKESEVETYVPELSLDSEEFNRILEKPDLYSSYAVDSSLVRLYHYNGRWRLATTRSIDASKTRWNSYRTFFQLFGEAATSQMSPLDWKTLPQDKVYFLALIHPENRIVTPHAHSALIHLTTLSKNEVGEWHEDLSHDLGIAKPIEFSLTNEISGNKMTSKELKDVVNELNWVYPGVVLRWTDENGLVQRTKLRNPSYEHVARLRGDRRSMIERYLELKTDADKQTIFEEFTKYYPEYKSVEQTIENMARAIHQTYLDYHVHHTVRFVSDKRIWEIIQELHTRFLRTREKTSLQLARQHINSLPFPVLAELLIGTTKRN